MQSSAKEGETCCVFRGLACGERDEMAQSGSGPAGVVGSGSAGASWTGLDGGVGSGEGQFFGSTRSDWVSGGVERLGGGS